MTLSKPHLSKRVALVTGSARKVGGAMARALAEAGADVAVHYRGNREAAEKTARAIRDSGRRAITVKGDVTRPRQVERIFERVEARLGPVDLLVNNVGDFLLKSLSDLAIEEWHYLIDSNLNSAFYCCRRAVPAMTKRGFGRIVNLGYGPCARLDALERTAAYHLAKTGLLVYTKALAREVAPHGVTVNMISPGTIFTSVNRPSKDTIPAGRYAAYRDLTEALRYLVSDEAAYVTGNNLIVAGGKYV